MLEKIKPLQPTVIPRSEHCISRADISDNALKVMYRLRGAGYQACLVGGGVRDLLLRLAPKDFDIATDAHPEEVYRLFRNCRLIGRRFRLAHVHFGPEIIEVATFRAMHEGATDDDVDDDSTDNGLTDPVIDGEGTSDASGLIISDNVYGTIEEDALRRDFTINALYYDIDDFAILDYTGGMADLNDGIIRLVGDPDSRYREDPVRMLRALRFAAKLDFRLHPDTEAPLYRLGHLLEGISSVRLFDEVLKLFLSGHAEATIELIQLYRLLNHLLPMTAQSRHRRPAFRRLLRQACINTDTRIAADKPVTPAFLFATLLWGPLLDRQAYLESAHGLTPHQARLDAAEQVIAAQCQYTALPRRFTGPMREIWMLQERLHQRSGKRPLRFVEHPRFRAAYDFLLLRAASGEQSTTDTDLAELADWWTQFQTLSVEQREQQVFSKKSPRKRSSRHRSSNASTAPSNLGSASIDSA